MNDTIGQYEHVGWLQYTPGIFAFLVFLSVSVLNVLILISFYRLRNNAFVRNSTAVITFVCTDLLNVLILTPTLASWLVVRPPYRYITCVFQSLPFVLSNYTSLLNLTSFCIWRLVVIKKVPSGLLKVKGTKYVFATLCVWILALVIISVPYFTMGNFNKVLLNCRRAVFRDVKESFRYFIILFVIPIIVMNVCLLVVAVFIKKLNNRVNVCQCQEFSKERVEVKSLDGKDRIIRTNSSNETRKTDLNTGTDAMAPIELYCTSKEADLVNSVVIRISEPKWNNRCHIQDAPIFGDSDSCTSDQLKDEVFDMAASMPKVLNCTENRNDHFLQNPDSSVITNFKRVDRNDEVRHYVSDVKDSIDDKCVCSKRTHNPFLVQELKQCKYQYLLRSTPLDEFRQQMLKYGPS